MGNTASIKKLFMSIQMECCSIATLTMGTKNYKTNTTIDLLLMTCYFPRGKDGRYASEKYKFNNLVLGIYVSFSSPFTLSIVFIYFRPAKTSPQTQTVMLNLYETMLYQGLVQKATNGYTKALFREQP